MVSGPIPGVRVGPYVVFKNHDIGGHDIKKYSDAAASIKSLRDSVEHHFKLPSRDSNAASGAAVMQMACGFNTNGWVKRWDKFRWDMLVPSTVDMWVRVEVDGWSFLPGKLGKSSIMDMPIMPEHRLSLPALLQQVSLSFPTNPELVVEFTTAGSIMSIESPPVGYIDADAKDPLVGTYWRTKQPEEDIRVAGSGSLTQWTQDALNTTFVSRKQQLSSVVSLPLTSPSQQYAFLSALAASESTFWNIMSKNAEQGQTEAARR